MMGVRVSGFEAPIAALATVHARLAAEAADEQERCHHEATAGELLAAAHSTQTQPTARQFLDALAARMEALLSCEANPDWMMSAILEEAESAGIIDASGAIRTGTAQLFVLDLLRDNPLAFEWAQISRLRGGEGGAHLPLNVFGVFSDR